MFVFKKLIPQIIYSQFLNNLATIMLVIRHVQYNNLIHRSFNTLRLFDYLVSSSNSLVVSGSAILDVSGITNVEIVPNKPVAA